MELFFSNLKEMAVITMLVILAGLTTTGYLTHNDSLATWAQTCFGTLFGGYFGYYIGGKMSSTNSAVTIPVPANTNSERVVDE